MVDPDDPQRETRPPDARQWVARPYTPTALPSPLARVAAFAAVVVAGVCGGLIGWAVAELQCEGDCTAVSGLGALGGATVAAAGVAVIAVLVLRAMAEWRRDLPEDQ